jgi:uncharacterized membrane protein
MLDVLFRELAYMARRQLYFTAFALSVGESILEWLPLGMTDLSAGYFRILCVGYALYAIGNVFVLMLLYFSDYRDAAWTAVLYAVCSIGFSLFSLHFPIRFYGFGFAAAGAVLFLCGLIMLVRYTDNLGYYILSVQPFYETEKKPFLYRTARKMDAQLAAAEERIAQRAARRRKASQH